MTVDFQQVSSQVHQLGEMAQARQQSVQDLRLRARGLLALYATEYEGLRERVARVVAEAEPNLRCAQPVDPALTAPEPLNAHFAAPSAAGQVTIIAADGSQIPYDRHSDIEFCMINVGAIQMVQASGEAPTTTIRSQLLYDDELIRGTGIISEAGLALLRDLLERTIQAELAAKAAAPVVTLTDGPMELWGSKDSQSEGADYRRNLTEYKKTLRRLHAAGAVTAGYVDKPSADLVVRLLEVMQTPEDNLQSLKQERPLRGVRDFDLFRVLLGPGERSAVFAIVSKSATDYPDDLALHFFYLNVGRAGASWVARVEIPAWVAKDPAKLDLLHAVLLNQCQIAGARPYPYLLHRAHETAVVSFEARDQITQMIARELRSRGIEPGEKSHKQFFKNTQGRTGY